MPSGQSVCVCVDGTLATRFPLEVILALFVTKFAICASWMLSMAAAHTHTHTQSSGLSARLVEAVNTSAH